MRGKIIKSIAGFYEVRTGEEVYRCRAKGIFRALGKKPLVGDDVEIDITDTVSVPMEGNVCALLPRKNELVRPNVANVDQALLIFAITHPAPSYNMLDRFLITMQERELDAILCFSKRDIATREEIDELRETYEACGCKVLFISSFIPESLGGVREILRGKTTVLTGPSGAGKSTLINTLCPAANMQTGELSRKISRGKNTTRHVELLSVEDLNGTAGPAPDSEGTYLVDTPGFTSLWVQDIEADKLHYYYPEFAKWEPDCRFNGCIHINEPDCAVKAALARGQISRIRYQNYCEIYEDLRGRKPVYGKKGIYPDIRVPLVVLQKDIVVRLVLFYQSIFKQQGLELGADEYRIEVVDLLYHGGDFGKMGASEIGAHPVSESLGFADIYYIAFRVHHKIDSGGLRKAVGFPAQKLMCHDRLPPILTRRARLRHVR